MGQKHAGLEYYLFVRIVKLRFARLLQVLCYSDIYRHI